MKTTLSPLKLTTKKMKPRTSNVSVISVLPASKAPDNSKGSSKMAEIAHHGWRNLLELKWLKLNSNCPPSWSGYFEIVVVSWLKL